ncbi:MAG: UDP-glucose 4-epimerase GalE, partial [Flavobacteriaceae bacterium]|nr:UDP-glucose 4-epimerase GalE [Flavobacteriaceae bacterium]
AVRDYIHVVDLAKAHIAALRRLIHGKNKEKMEFFNVGTGKGSSVLDVIKAFEKVSNKKLNYKIVGRREGDITSAYADISFANKELGWQTKLDLEDALASAWKWQLKQD